MKNFTKSRVAFCVGLLVLMLTGGACAVGPVHGFLFTSNKFAGVANQNTAITSAKKAEGCQHMVLGLVAFGDAGAGSIANQNGIKKIATVDHSALSVLTLVYSRYCTLVSGE